jgi:hypothetical protein
MTKGHWLGALMLLILALAVSLFVAFQYENKIKLRRSQLSEVCIEQYGDMRRSIPDQWWDCVYRAYKPLNP